MRPLSSHVHEAVQASLNPSRTRLAPPAHVAKAIQASTSPVQTRPMAHHVATALGQKGIPSGQTGTATAVQRTLAVVPRTSVKAPVQTAGVLGAKLPAAGGARPPLDPSPLPSNVAQRKGNTAIVNATRSRTVQRASDPEAVYPGLDEYQPRKNFHYWYPAEAPPSAKAEAQQWTTQGWKIHIGTTARHAEDLLAICLPAVRELAIGHKVVASPSDFQAMKDDQAGKLITIYPQNTVQFSQVWYKLRPLLSAHAAGLDRSPAAGHEIVLESTGHMTARYGGYIDSWLRHTETDQKVILDDRGDPYPPKGIGYVEYPDQILPKDIRQALIDSSPG